MRIAYDFYVVDFLLHIINKLEIIIIQLHKGILAFHIIRLISPFNFHTNNFTSSDNVQCDKKCDLLVQCHIKMVQSDKIIVNDTPKMTKIGTKDNFSTSVWIWCHFIT